MTMRDKLASRIMLHDLQLLRDFGVGGDIYINDPECRDAAYIEADAIIAALPDMVEPLVWEDFGGRGAKAAAWGKASYLITKWSDGRYELVESYPGYEGDNLAGGFVDTLEAAKAAANAHHHEQIMAAFNGANTPTDPT